jgi:hypothetical protein
MLACLIHALVIARSREWRGTDHGSIAAGLPGHAPYVPFNKVDCQTAPKHCRLLQVGRIFFGSRPGTHLPAASPVQWRVRSRGPSVGTRRRRHNDLSRYLCRCCALPGSALAGPLKIQMVPPNFRQSGPFDSPPLPSFAGQSREFSPTRDVPRGRKSSPPSLHPLRAVCSTGRACFPFCLGREKPASPVAQ